MDTSPNGWLAVAKLRNRSELSDELRRKLEKVDKEIRRSRSYGGAQKKFSKFQNHGQGGDVRTNRGPPQRRSPEEHLFNAASRSGRGSVPTATKKTTFTGNARISGRRYRSHGRRGREVSRTRTRTCHSVQGEGREGAGAMRGLCNPHNRRHLRSLYIHGSLHNRSSLHIRRGRNSWGGRGQQQANPGGNGMGSAGREIRHFSGQVWRILIFNLSTVG